MAAGIRRVKGVRQIGQRVGNWLSTQQGQDLLGAISPKSLRGKRDAAMLSLLLACGLRRSEVVGLASERIQRREDHWAIVDLVGKAGHVRTVLTKLKDHLKAVLSEGNIFPYWVPLSRTVARNTEALWIGRSANSGCRLQVRGPRNARGQGHVSNKFEYCVRTADDFWHAVTAFPGFLWYKFMNSIQ